jgi:hypothetical protein
MKTKAALLILLLAAWQGLAAQDENQEPFRPSRNNFTVEVNFKPFNAENPVFIDGFRGRFFLNDKLAIRTGVNVEYRKIYNETPETHDNVVYYNSTDQRSTTLGVTTGIEYHFLKTKRFSPYGGIIVGYENRSSKGTYQNVDYSYNGYVIDKTDLTNAWYETVYIESGGYYITTQVLAQRGYSKLSANAVLGADFYILRHVYLGIELGFGYNAYFYKEVDVKVNGVFYQKYPKANESSVGFNVNNALRLGFWF